MPWVCTGKPLSESRTLWHQTYAMSLPPHSTCCPGRTVGERVSIVGKMMNFGNCSQSIRLFRLFMISLSLHWSENRLGMNPWDQDPTTLWMPWTTLVCNQMGLRARGGWDSFLLAPPRQDASVQRETKKEMEKREREKERWGKENGWFWIPDSSLNQS